MQLFLYETFTNTIGGAVFVANLNSGGLTIMLDCEFHNNLGIDGGSITLDQAGIIIAVNTTFSTDKKDFSQASPNLTKIIQKKILREDILIEK